MILDTIVSFLEKLFNKWQKKNKTISDFLTDVFIASIFIAIGLIGIIWVITIFSF